jgi:hypothetical protein
MNGSCDVLDYLNLGSNLFRNLNTGPAIDQIHKLPDEVKESPQLETATPRRAHLAECQKAIRQAIGTARQALKNAKQRQDDSAGFVLALELCKLPFSPDMCDAWQDKVQLQSLDEELASIKAQVKAKLGEDQYKDLRQGGTAATTIERLDRYIAMRRCLDEHEEIAKQLTE